MTDDTLGDIVLHDDALAAIDHYWWVSMASDEIEEETGVDINNVWNDIARQVAHRKVVDTVAKAR